jgi:hypothetical protein|tara:strand:- start:689 stop:904 length:216 start_codon:yes stop_codon:yes gene_type:complete
MKLTLKPDANTESLYAGLYAILSVIEMTRLTEAVNKHRNPEGQGAYDFAFAAFMGASNQEEDSEEELAGEE